MSVLRLPAIGIVVVLGVLLLARVQVPGTSGDLPIAPPRAVPSPARTPSTEPSVDVVAQGLEVPWALAFAPDGTLYVSERGGRVVRLRDGNIEQSTGQVRLRQTVAMMR